MWLSSYAEYSLPRYLLTSKIRRERGLKLFFLLYVAQGSGPSPVLDASGQRGPELINTFPACSIRQTQHNLSDQPGLSGAACRVEIGIQDALHQRLRQQAPRSLLSQMSAGVVVSTEGTP